MKINIQIETNDKNQEYTLWPYGEWELSKESEVNIIIKNNPSEDDINQEVERRIREKKIKEIKI